MADNRESNVEEAEHPDEDQIETSDTETDFQIVSDKVAELNMMKVHELIYFVPGVETDFKYSVVLGSIVSDSEVDGKYECGFKRKRWCFDTDGGCRGQGNTAKIVEK